MHLGHIWAKGPHFVILAISSDSQATSEEKISQERRGQQQQRVCPASSDAAVVRKERSHKDQVLGPKTQEVRGQGMDKGTANRHRHPTGIHHGIRCSGGVMGSYV